MSEAKLMLFNNNISEDRRQQLLLVYKKKRDDIRHKISVLKNQFKDTASMIWELESLQITSSPQSGEVKTSTASQYSSKWSWKDRISFALTIANKPLTLQAIIEVLQQYDSFYLDHRKRAIASISATLSLKSGLEHQNKDFVKSLNRNGEYEYSVGIKKNKESTINKILEELELPF